MKNGKKLMKNDQKIIILLLIFVLTNSLIYPVYLRVNLALVASLLISVKKGGHYFVIWLRKPVFHKTPYLRGMLLLFFVGCM